MKHDASNTNVYADLGYEEPENMLVRARLAMAISDLIEQEGWTRKEAAQHLHITETKLSNIIRGRIRQISIDKLVNILASAGRHVSVTINHAA